MPLDQRRDSTPTAFNEDEIPCDELSLTVSRGARRRRHWDELGQFRCGEGSYWRLHGYPQSVARSAADTGFER